MSPYKYLKIIYINDVIILVTSGPRTNFPSEPRLSLFCWQKIVHKTKVDLKATTSPKILWKRFKELSRTRQIVLRWQTG